MRCSTHCFVLKSTLTHRMQRFSRRSKTKQPFVMSIKKYLISLMLMFILITQTVMQLILSLQ